MPKSLRGQCVSRGLVVFDGSLEKTTPILKRTGK